MTERKKDGGRRPVGITQEVQRWQHLSSHSYDGGIGRPEAGAIVEDGSNRGKLVGRSRGRRRDRQTTGQLHVVLCSLWNNCDRV